MKRDRLSSLTVSVCMLGLSVSGCTDDAPRETTTFTLGDSGTAGDGQAESYAKPSYADSYNSGDTTITFRYGATRLGACGF